MLAIQLNDWVIPHSNNIATLYTAIVLVHVVLYEFVIVRIFIFAALYT